MADAALAGNAVARIRKERIHTTMLIELLALLVFMAMAFAFVMKEEGDRANPWHEAAVRLQAQVDGLKKENRALRAQITSLNAKVRDLETANRMLAANAAGAPLPNGTVVIRASDVGKDTAELENAKQVIAELQADNARLRATIASLRGGTGVGRPKCTVTAGYLVHVDAYGDDTFRVRSTWTAGAAAVAKQIPGAERLTSGSPLSRAQFANLAGQVAAWGNRQAQPCAFTATFSEHHGSIQLFKRQLGLAEQYFYVSRR